MICILISLFISCQESVKHLGLCICILCRVGPSIIAKSIVSKATRFLNCLRCSIQCLDVIMRLSIWLACNRALVRPILELRILPLCNVHTLCTIDIKLYLFESLQGQVVLTIEGWQPHHGKSLTLDCYS